MLVKSHKRNILTMQDQNQCNTLLLSQNIKQQINIAMLLLQSFTLIVSKMKTHIFQNAIFSS